MTEEEADALKRDIAGLGVPLALIVGDTASSFFPGDDENSNVQAGTYARTLRGLNECEGDPAIVALCHPTKGASRSNLLPRGGGAFLNELDGNLALWSHSLGEVTELHWCGKIRGPDFSPLGYRLRPVPTGLTDEKDRPEMTIIAEPMSEEAVADHTKQALANEDVVLQALRDHPGGRWRRLPATPDGSTTTTSPRSGGCNARSPRSPTTSSSRSPEGRPLGAHREGRESPQQGQPVSGKPEQIVAVAGTVAGHRCCYVS